MILTQQKQGHRGRGETGAIAAALALSLALVASGPGRAASAESARALHWDPSVSFAVPSGQEIAFLDVIDGPESAAGSALRVRFLAPALARDTGDMGEDADTGGFAGAEEDMAALCQNYVLPQLLAEARPLPDQIIIVLADRPVEFGVADPDATQYFEAYRPEDGACFWEGF